MGFQMTERTRMERKKVDDVLGGEEMWRDADATTGISCVLGIDVVDKVTHPDPAHCPQCNNNRAYFFQIQTRSADEPMTISKFIRVAVYIFFTEWYSDYRCTTCAHRWKDN
jgi:DNA-directed RNA polymerase III subunit RPC11